MSNSFALHALYLLHLMLPMRLVRWHCQRLSLETLGALHRLFPPTKKEPHTMRENQLSGGHE